MWGPVFLMRNWGLELIAQGSKSKARRELHSSNLCTLIPLSVGFSLSPLRSLQTELKFNTWRSSLADDCVLSRSSDSWRHWLLRGARLHCAGIIPFPIPTEFLSSLTYLRFHHSRELYPNFFSSLSYLRFHHSRELYPNFFSSVAHSSVTWELQPITNFQESFAIIS